MIAEHSGQFGEYEGLMFRDLFSHRSKTAVSGLKASAEKSARERSLRKPEHFRPVFPYSISVRNLVAVSVMLVASVFFTPEHEAHEYDPYRCPEDHPPAAADCCFYSCLYQDNDFTERLAFCPCTDTAGIEAYHVRAIEIDCETEAELSDHDAGSFFNDSYVYDENNNRLLHSRHYIAIGQLTELKENACYKIKLCCEDKNGNMSAETECACCYHTPEIICCWEDTDGDGLIESSPCYAGDVPCFQGFP